MRISDWSSDVCSSDLLPAGGLRPGNRPNHRLSGGGLFLPQARPPAGAAWTGKKSRRLMQLSNIPKITTCQMWNDFVMDIDTSSDKSCTARSEEHTSELQSLMRNSYAVFCFKNKKNT